MSSFSWYTFDMLTRFGHTKAIRIKACKRVIRIAFFMPEINQYLLWKGMHRQERTVKSYAPWINKFSEKTQQKGIGEVEFNDISGFSIFLKQNYAPKTQEYAMTVIRDYVGYWIKRKPLKIILDDVRVHRARSISHKPVTPEEYVSILEKMSVQDLSGLRDVVLVRMLYDTGARISEICALKKDDFDLVNRYAQIPNAKRKDDGFIFWSTDTNEFLRIYLDQKPAKIFPTIRTCQRIIQKYADLAGIKKHITCHSFRHSKAWRVLDNGGTVKDVQSILRHKSPVSSFRYLDWHAQKNREQAEKFL